MRACRRWKGLVQSVSLYWFDEGPDSLLVYIRSPTTAQPLVLAYTRWRMMDACGSPCLGTLWGLCWGSSSCFRSYEKELRNKAAGVQRMLRSRTDLTDPISADL